MMEGGWQSPLPAAEGTAGGFAGARVCPCLTAKHGAHRPFATSCKSQARPGQCLWAGRHPHLQGCKGAIARAVFVGAGCGVEHSLAIGGHHRAGGLPPNLSRLQNDLHQRAVGYERLRIG